MTIPQALEQSQPGLVSRVTLAIKKHQLNHRAEQTYLHWISRFVLFHGLKNPDNLEPQDCQDFLEYLGERGAVSRARRNQAHQALSFFYQDVLGKSEQDSVAAA